MDTCADSIGAMHVNWLTTAGRQRVHADGTAGRSAVALLAPQERSQEAATVSRCKGSISCGRCQSPPPLTTCIAW